MKKYSKLLLSLIASNIVAGPSNKSEKSNKSSSASLRSFVKKLNVAGGDSTIHGSVTSTAIVRKAPALSVNATIISWCEEASSFEEQEVLFNLLGEKLRFLPESVIKEAKKKVVKELEKLRQTHKTEAENKDYFKVDVKKYREALNEMLQTFDNHEPLVGSNFSIKNTALFDDLKGNFELTNPKVTCDLNGDFLRLKFYNNTKRTSIAQIKLDEKNFVIRLFKNKDGVSFCQLDFNSEINERSDVIKMKFVFKVDDFVKVIKGIESDTLLTTNTDTNGKTLDGLISNAILNQIKTFDHKEIAEFFSKADNILIKSLLGTEIKFDQPSGNLMYCAAAFNQSIKKQNTEQTQDGYNSFIIKAEIKETPYVNEISIGNNNGFQFAHYYAKNVVEINNKEMKLYKDQVELLNDTKISDDEKKKQYNNLQKMTRQEISNIQASNASYIKKHPTVSYLFENNSRLFVTQEVRELVNTGIRNMKIAQESYSKLQKKNPDVHYPKLAQPQKVKKTSCCC
ncbi:hypothetical protein [Alphaproteobacteria bacterium endosymbiont of Tiliacea citrago]|uniref:hypothetical protein n=1 Tax=Alphaproteobacteria bacterium endosymbiont of Tiliacea citrago TaxID=3077944 RepID=UPI00313C9A8F